MVRRIFVRCLIALALIASFAAPFAIERTGLVSLPMHPAFAIASTIAVNADLSDRRAGVE